MVKCICLTPVGSSLGKSRLTVLVLQELWEVEELGYEFLDVVGVVHEGLPGGRDGMELPVGAIKPGNREALKTMNFGRNRRKKKKKRTAGWL